MFGFDDVLSGLFGAGLSFAGAKQGQGFSEEQVQQQEQFQERMSSTAYQRQMADMQKAGLNPILAFSKGGGASAPSGGMASSSGPNLAGDVASTQASARATAQQNQQLQNMAAEKEATEAQADQARATAQRTRTNNALDVLKTSGGELEKAQADTLRDIVATSAGKAALTAKFYRDASPNNPYQAAGVAAGAAGTVLESTAKGLSDSKVPRKRINSFWDSLGTPSP